MHCFVQNVAPYQIIQPSTNDNIQIISSAAKNLTLECSLKVNIPSNVTITWLHNGDTILSQTTLFDQTTITVELSRVTSQLPGVYQCAFNDTAGFILRKDIIVAGMYVQIWL